MPLATSLPVSPRVADLLARMTLEEKFAQLGSIWVYEILTDMHFDPDKAARLFANGIGQITRLAGASSVKPGEAAQLANKIQRYLVENTRLGIPAMIHEECCAGYMARDATVFPQIIGLASTWEPELAERMSAVVREQMRAAGAHQGLSPVLDVARDPRWGRVEETFGEDPYLVAAMGTAFVRGLQGGGDWTKGVVATAKHFVGYGLTEGGFNWAPAHIPPRELREEFLYPFEAAVKVAGLQSVMNGYNEIDGVPCAASKELLTDILRDEWGFDGIVVSDYFAIAQIKDAHQLVTDPAEAAAIGLEAGIDIELPSTNYYGDPLRDALTKGIIDETLIDRSVARLLEMKFKLGLFDNPYVAPNQAPAVFDTPPQRALAREIARKSIILLKNEGNLLPLQKNLQTIAIIGPNAHTTRHLLGDYAYQAHVETLWEMTQSDHNVFGIPVPDKVELDGKFYQMHTLLEGISEKVGDQIEILYAKGCEVNSPDTSGFAEAIEIAQNSDVAVLFLGDKAGLTDSCTTGEARDRAELHLPGVQQALLEAVHATGTPIVLVLVNGRPLTINWANENIPAILEAWLPGEEGAEAVADILFGDANPGGKLPMTFPRGVGQIPIYHRHKPTGGRSNWKVEYVEMSNKPLYPFGYGLSYTTFALENLCVARDAISPGETFQARVDVRNTGARAGEEVVQLYARDVAASVTRPVKELKGFKRVHLQPGEAKTILFTFHTDQFRLYNKTMQSVLEAGEFLLFAGTSSDDLPLQAHFTLTAHCNHHHPQKIFFAMTEVKELEQEWKKSSSPL